MNGPFLLKGKKMEIRPVWFDSLGAKSMCVLVRTPDISLLVDPGAAIMQPRYPAPDELKLYYLGLAIQAILQAAKDATHIVITHYHYDHFQPDFLKLFSGKILWIKDPNRWINHSQWERARAFLKALAEAEGLEFRERPTEKEDYPDPVEHLPLAARVERREDLLRKWRRRFMGHVDLWEKGPWVNEGSFGGRVVFADGLTFKIEGTTVRFTHPLFHGVEYAGPGWVLAVVVEQGGTKLLYSSDLQGPIIEDYAAWIVQEHPDILILDGPATYLLGPLQSKQNLKRALKNCTRAVQGAGARLTILDHHLTREPRFREKAAEAFACGATTGAEAMEKDTLTDRLAYWKAQGKLDEVLAQAKEQKLDLDLLSERYLHHI